ncbi:hypothetical protein Acr_01g0007950 [Actinidia rufa]|uniref:Uncharacterized protein n=1 Tax=Actinidia rufa TaxID=165716 RepID=A0A7J0E4A4_9ERIC|nr:hypothetical protein Acr_01g0007950 [Actinidia rufa]
MASRSSNHSGSHEPHRETPYAFKTLGRRGGKLLDDAQRAAKATSGQNSMRPSKTAALAQNEDKIKEPTLPPRQGRERRQHRSYVSLDSRTYRKSIALSKQRRSPDRAKSGMDLHETLNAK